MRVALYARYSTDMQKPETIAVQNGNMRAYLAKAGWQEIGAWADEAISGATLNRPGIQALLAACERREVDVVLADELDRLSRGQSHTAKVYERLQFLGIRLVTVAEGEITRLHVGMKGTMNAEQISATSRKTRDALADRHMKGLNAGGRAYGYELDFQLDARGDRIPGHLKVNASEAAHIVSIYEQYAMGRSAKAIAADLYRRGVPGPRGGKWSASTINGNKKRGTGVLNNQAYVGRPEHQRQTFRKDPETGKRHAFATAEGVKKTAEALHLRIVSDELWGQVKARQEQTACPHGSDVTPFWAKQRPKYLLTGKVMCGVCGSNYGKVGKLRSGCHANTNYGDAGCTNKLTIRIGELEEQVLAPLKDDMLQPDVVEAFVKEYVAESNRLARERERDHGSLRHELKGIISGIERLTAAIVKGVDASLVREELNRLGQRKVALEEILGASAEPSGPVMFHTRLAQIYRHKVENLLSAYTNEASRTEAQEVIRGLIERIVLTPVDGALQVEMTGELAAMLLISQPARQKNPRELMLPRFDKSRWLRGQDLNL
ncbi:recombinase family protein [Sphingomonas aurantiaca]|uniref:recombinase family protein n=1 Tax=Sphingomonas aurantiaca TaxID=185949 RepID=UPI00335409F2